MIFQENWNYVTEGPGKSWNVLTVKRFYDVMSLFPE